MGSFPPPTASEIVHQPDDAPFPAPGGGTSRRRSLWIALGIVALLTVVALVLFFADELGEDDDAATSGDSTTGSEAAGDGANPASVATVAEPTVAERTGSSNPNGLPPSAESTSFAPDPDEPAAPGAPHDPPPSTSQTSTTNEAPGADLTGLTISRVIVSPGKSGGNPVEGAVPVLPGVVPTFPSSTGYVCLFWNAAGMPNGVPNGIIWTLDGRVVGSLDDTTFIWNAGSTVRPNWCVPSRPDGLDDGRHRVEYFVAGRRMFVAEFVIGD
jgi:hypothetical protein